MLLSASVNSISSIPSPVNSLASVYEGGRGKGKGREGGREEGRVEREERVRKRIGGHTSVPVKESLASEHSSELLADTFEELLDSCRVSNECDGHLQTLGWDVAHARLDIVRDPLDEVG